MGAGIAKQIKERWYNEVLKSSGRLKQEVNNEQV